MAKRVILLNSWWFIASKEIQICPKTKEPYLPCCHFYVQVTTTIQFLTVDDLLHQNKFKIVSTKQPTHFYVQVTPSKSICNSFIYCIKRDSKLFRQKSQPYPTPLLYPVWPLLCPGHSLKILFLANCFRLGLNWLGGMKSTFRIIILDVEWRSLF